MWKQVYRICPNLKVIKALIYSTRPKQWSKNLIIYFAFLFTVEQAWDLHDLDAVFVLFIKTTFGFLIFSLLTGAIYLFNDTLDVKEDQKHPKKKFRPLPSGELSKITAILFSVLFGGSSIILSYILEPRFSLICIIYVVIFTSYCMLLKRIALLDVMTISAGFVLRAAAGAAIINVPISPWLYVCTGLGALLIALGKRRNELDIAGIKSKSQRPVLTKYSHDFINQLISVVAPSTLIAYIFYTFTANGLPDNHAMMLTIPFVIYGLFRYLFLIQFKNLGETPEDILLTDKPIIISILGWLITAGLVLTIFR